MYRTEIGSEFWDVPLSADRNNLFVKEPAWFVSGRAALSSVIAEIKLRQSVRCAWLPSWCCDSMIYPFLQASIDVRFYPVFVQNRSLCHELPSALENDILFLMSYFGYEDGAPEVPGFEATIIRDVTHSVFSKSYRDADYSFGSLRKWCAFKTGGFAYGVSATDAFDSRYYCTRERAMQEKSAYIAGKTESKSFLAVFAEAEEHLEECPVSCGAPEDISAAKKLDVAFIKSQRRKNAAVLLDALSEIAIFPKLKDEDCPLFVPILVKNSLRDDLRKYLIQNEIYCPVHWPISAYHSLNLQTQTLYNDELSLVCDQRYSEEDMLRTVKVIKKFFER